MKKKYFTKYLNCHRTENIEFGDLGEELGFALPDLEQDDLTFMDAFDDLTDPATSPNSHPHSADDVNMKVHDFLFVNLMNAC